DLSGDRDLVAAPELRDRHLPRRGLVSARPPEQQVTHRREPERPQLAGQPRPHRRERLDRQLQTFGPRQPPRSQESPLLHRPQYGAGPGPHPPLPLPSSNQKSPSVPGPACAPTTAPSPVTTSIAACGRSARTRASSAMRRSGATACASPTLSVGTSSVAAARRSRSSTSAFPVPRTRLSGTTSPSSSPRIGLTLRSVPANAAPRPIRP